LLLDLREAPLLVELPRFAVERPDVDRELDERLAVERLAVERDALERRLVEREALERPLALDVSCFCAFSKSR
jgi:hypothetical protein